MRTQLNRRQWILASAAAPLALRPILAQAARRGIRAAPIRLHSNENPYGPSQSARDAIAAAMGESNLYPSAKYRELEQLIAAREGLTPDHVVLGAGSHEVLRMTAMAYGLAGGEIVTAYPTFEGMERYAARIGAHVHRVPINDGLVMDLAKMDQRMTQAVKLAFVCNPNNPTGTITPNSVLQPFVETASKRAVVFVDEAYYELVTDPSYKTMVPLVAEGRNVIVSRTFSKVYGLAGLRVGYALARPDIASRLRAYRTDNAINILGLRAAIAAYQDPTFVTWSRDSIAEEREKVVTKLQAMEYRSVPSQTNFIFFNLKRPIGDFQRAMAAQGILVGRPFPPYLDWCRLSIGKPKEMAAFMDAFRLVMNEPTGN